MVAHPALALDCVFGELLEAEGTRRLALARYGGADTELDHLVGCQNSSDIQPGPLTTGLAVQSPLTSRFAKP